MLSYLIISHHRFGVYFTSVSRNATRIEKLILIITRARCTVAQRSSRYVRMLVLTNAHIFSTGQNYDNFAPLKTLLLTLLSYWFPYLKGKFCKERAWNHYFTLLYNSAREAWATRFVENGLGSLREGQPKTAMSMSTPPSLKVASQGRGKNNLVSKNLLLK